MLRVLPADSLLEIALSWADPPQLSSCPTFRGCLYLNIPLTPKPSDIRGCESWVRTMAGNGCGTSVLAIWAIWLSRPQVSRCIKGKKRYIVKFKVSQNRRITIRVLKQGNIISSRKLYTFPNLLKCATWPWQRLSSWLQSTKWPWIQKFPTEAGFCPTHQTGHQDQEVINGSQKWNIGVKAKHGQRCKCEAKGGEHMSPIMILLVTSWWRRKKVKFGSQRGYFMTLNVCQYMGRAKNGLWPQCIPIQWWSWRWGLLGEILPMGRSLGNVPDPLYVEKEVS